MPKKPNYQILESGLPGSAMDGGHIKRSSGLTDEVYKRIRADIMSLKIQPGTRLMIDGLARELGVSQTPVREALGMLEAIGLVTKRQFFGYCTAPKFNRDQYKKLFEVRLLLEPYAARVAAEKIEQPAIKELGSLLGRMEPESVDGPSKSHELFADQDSEFHARIASAAGNDLITDALDRMHTHLHVFRLGVASEYASEAMFEHLLIEKSLREHNPHAAEKAMRAHIENSFKRLIPFMDRQE